MKYIDDPAGMERMIIKNSYCAAGIPLLYSIISRQYPVFLGFLSGLFITTFFLLFKLHNIKCALELGRKKAEVFIRNRCLLEYSVYLLFLTYAVRSPRVNFLALIIGLLMMKMTVLAMVVIDLIRGRLERENSIGGGLLKNKLEE